MPTGNMKYSLDTLFHLENKNEVKEFPAQLRTAGFTKAQHVC